MDKNRCGNCPWKHPETCKVCKQDEGKAEERDKKPDTSAYGQYYLKKISLN